MVHLKIFVLDVKFLVCQKSIKNHNTVLKVGTAPNTRVEKSWQHGQQADGTFAYFIHYSEHSGLNLAGGRQLLLL